MSGDDVESIEPGRIIAGRYRVERKLGAGGMGSVYLVRHVHTEERLALKIVHSAIITDTQALERFRREARTPARIDSDYAVRVTDADVAEDLGGAPFLVMEYLRGEDLEQLSERRGMLPAPEVVKHLRQAARALDKAHALGIVHRDLKPENLFLTKREDGGSHIKILDFGIAKFTSASGEDLAKSAATSPGAIFGTPLYMSPEQAKGESSSVCPQTDVWALGLIAHKLLTGRDLWTAQTLTHLIAQIAYEPVPTPSGLGVELGPSYDTWLLRCCDREPASRWPSAGEAVDALAQALGVNTGPLESAREVPVEPPPPSIAVAVTGNEGPTSRSPDAFSKTDTQLATTGGPPKRESSGKLPLVAVGLVLAAGVAGLLVVQPWREGAATGTSPESTTATAEQPLAPDGTSTVVVSPIEDAASTVAPPASATADPAPSASASAMPTAKRVGPPSSGNPPPYKPPVAPKTVPPPPPVDPLAGRH